MCNDLATLSHASSSSPLVTSSIGPTHVSSTHCSPDAHMPPHGSAPPVAVPTDGPAPLPEAASSPPTPAPPSPLDAPTDLPPVPPPTHGSRSSHSNPHPPVSVVSAQATRTRRVHLTMATPHDHHAGRAYMTVLCHAFSGTEHDWRGKICGHDSRVRSVWTTSDIAASNPTRCCPTALARGL